jgi:hypothetical protein
MALFEQRIYSEFMNSTGGRGVRLWDVMRRSKFPFAVEIAQPVRGLRKRAMYDFHARSGIVAHPVYKIYEKNGRRSVRWRFAS